MRRSTAVHEISSPSPADMAESTRHSVPQTLDPSSRQEHLDRLEAEVHALREQLRMAQRLAAVGTMTAMVAHEFNNILTPIINYAQLARRDPKMVEKAISRASEGGQRASDICKAILGLTRQQSSGVRAENLADLLDEALTAMGRELARDGIELVLTIPPDLKVETRRLELQQVLLNMIINARTAVVDKGRRRSEMPGESLSAQSSRSNRPAWRPRIEIDARRIDGPEALSSASKAQVVIAVSDNGTGIAAENMDKIFRPFFSTKSQAAQEGDDADGPVAPSASADQQPPSEDGHGLGLAICQEIITSMGGEICVDSTPGEGASFTIHLPDTPQ